MHKNVPGLAALLVAGLSVTSSAADLLGLNRGTPELKSATTLAFGPEDILFIGDSKSAAVFAVATGDTQGNAAAASIN